eukprot:CAMPEP_0196228536 /NCGR_PEP_ID=MMETSP0913-20130531/424_1 /TAXON_ID=49265 /ORGANISM="Thalassiosira rotula, Strain GSO102" /LENGTH=99 /DNA_ID=CAMNT_0041508199 /DNA_START=92 /DNA_END=388 /DNA_ORIENTATION=+
MKFSMIKVSALTLVATTTVSADFQSIGNSFLRGVKDDVVATDAADKRDNVFGRKDLDSFQAVGNGAKGPSSYSGSHSYDSKASSSYSGSSSYDSKASSS